MLKDIFAVQAILGHKNCESTRKYIDLAKAYSDVTQDEYETRVADTIALAQKLIEVGFEYHMEMEGHKILRRKMAYNGLSW